MARLPAVKTAFSDLIFGIFNGLRDGLLTPVAFIDILYPRLGDAR